MTDAATGWTPASRPPDEDRTVLISTRSGEEPVWLGYYDSVEGWWTVEGERVEVAGWMDLPAPMPGAGW